MVLKSSNIEYPDTPFELWRHLLILGRRGSEAHGTFIPSTDPKSIDDRDLYGVVIPPTRYYLGLSKWDHAESIKGVWDVVLDEFRKFASLAKKQNPNVLQTLWLQEEDYLYIHPLGHLLINNRHLFRSRSAAYHSFTGYAHGQLKRMTHFQKYEGYMGDKRKKLVQEFGFDVKNAAHLIRLLHMGYEYLRDGILHVRRTWDRPMIMNIKQGGWTLDEIQSEADKYFEMCKKEVDRSPLPEEPDHEAIEKLTIKIIQDFLGRSYPAPDHPSCSPLGLAPI